MQFRVKDVMADGGPDSHTGRSPVSKAESSLKAAPGDRMGILYGNCGNTKTEAGQRKHDRVCSVLDRAGGTQVRRLFAYLTSMIPPIYLSRAYTIHIRPARKER